MKNFFLNRIKTPLFVPPHTKGDKDFDGHGPNINCDVHIEITKDKKHILAKVNMKAAETESDWTTSEGDKDFFIFSCTDKQTIEKINSPLSSSVCYTDKDHDEDFVVSGIGETNTSAQNNGWMLNNYDKDGLVSFYRFIGDTNGDEAGTKTGVQIFFNPIDITIEGEDLEETLLDVPDGIGTCGSNTCASSASAALLKFYGINTSCDEMHQRMRSSANAINIGNFGIDPNSLRDRLNEISNQFTLEEINDAGVIERIKNLIKSGIPVLPLIGWGSKTVKYDYCRSDDSISLNPNSDLHYIVIDGFNRQTNTFRIVDNGTRRFINSDYLKNVILWHPENLFIEGFLYGCGVKPGKIIFGKKKHNGTSEPPVDETVNEMFFEFRTGSDDLRGGNDNINVTINFKNHTSQTTNNINKGKGFDRNQTNTVMAKLNHPVKVSEISSIVFHTTFEGGWNGDNWDMDALKITAQNTQIFNESGSPLFRFTGDKKTFTAEIK